MSASDEKKIYITYFISTSILVLLVLAAIFFSVDMRTRRFIHEDNLIRARSLFNATMLMWKWNADYEGVYVIKKNGVPSNPYLAHPDIRANDGRVLTLRHHAQMTRELSEYAVRSGLSRLHITSLRPTNPRNKPDAFEEQSLRRFAQYDIQEEYRIEKQNDRTVFRYIAPLRVTKDCLACHADEQLTVGSVRGGVSIIFDIDDVQNQLKRSTIVTIVSGIATTLILLAFMYYLMSRLVRKIKQARLQIERIAITDELTGIYNRRHLLSRFAEELEKGRRAKAALSCILIDIDHFKDVNDTLGHLAGDAVLKGLAEQLRGIIRTYDIVGRYGGEEFLIVLPDTNLEQAWNLAERMRMNIKEHPLHGAAITISLGVTCLQDNDRVIDDMIKRADLALYRAKDAGRDRVEWLPA